MKRWMYAQNLLAWGDFRFSSPRESYLTRYPNGPHAADARRRLANRAQVLTLKGAAQALQDGAVILLDLIRNLGGLANDLLHFDLGAFISDLGNIGINIGELCVWGLRVVTGAYFGSAVADYFMRDRALGFIQQLIRNCSICL